MPQVILRAQALFDEEDWTEAHFSGPAAEDWAMLLAAQLFRLDWTVYISEDGDEFVELGENEDGA